MGKIFTKDVEIIIDSFSQLNEQNKALVVYYNIKNLNLKSFLLLIENSILSYEELFFYLSFFESSSNIKFSKEEYENISKIKQLKVKDIDNLKKEKEKEYYEIAKKIIFHLNKIFNKKYKAETYFSFIIPLLKKGYTIQDFQNVHYYYLYRWGLNNKMSPYLRPKTLYNKFNERVMESDSFWNKIKKYKKEIEKILQTFFSLEEIYFEKTIGNIKDNLKEELGKHESTVTLVEYIRDVERRNVIASWLDKGYSVDDILFTINVYFEKYGTQKEILPHITLEQILDEKFPKRVEGAKKIKLLANSTDISKQTEVKNNALNKWLSKSNNEEKKEE